MTSLSTNDHRLNCAQRWLTTLGVCVSDMRSASQDASFRRYFRLSLASAHRFDNHTHAPGDTLILMDAPPPQEDVAPFSRLAAALAGIGWPVPLVLASDESQGFLLLSDLGSTDMLTILQQEPHLAELMYSRAGNLLHCVQRDGAPVAAGLPHYDAALLNTELALFKDWLCGRHLQHTWSHDDEREWRAICDALVTNALRQPQVLVHRDFHSRNLMINDDLDLSVIDFQDAVLGPLTYDLASLLRDCYVRWPLEQVTGWACEWLDTSPLAQHYDQAQYLRWFFLMGVQRHLKAVGIFARLAHRDDKWRYLDDVPRTLGYIAELNTRYPELDWLARLIDERCLPALQT